MATQPRPLNPGIAPERTACTRVLAAFTRTGFRQTTMLALADAMGVSRQTLYNRFSGKDAVLAWAVNGLADALHRDALAALDTPERPTGAVLLDAFQHWLGPIVELLQTGPHAQEILGLSKAARQDVVSSPLDGIDTAIAGFLMAREACPSTASATDLAYLLAMAGKGQMHVSASVDAFRAGMARAIRGAGLAMD